MGSRLGAAVVALALLSTYALAASADDGQLDASFADEGVLVADLGSDSDAVAGVALAPGGGLVVVADVPGANGRDVMVAAFTSGGVPDAGFAQTGRITADFGGDERANAVAIAADGSIVAMGTRDKDGRHEIVLLRYRSDGTLDAGFAGTGRRVLTFTDGADNVGGGVAIDFEGRIVVAGTRTTPAGSVIAVARLLPDGELDASLNGNGKRFVDFGVDNGSNAFGAAVALQDDRKIVVAGTRIGAGGSDFVLARLEEDGDLDPGFNGSGKVSIDFGGTDRAHAVAVRPDGAIAVAGERAGASGSDFAVAIRLEDGEADTRFKGNGKATTDFGGDEVARAIVPQPNGMLVVVGERDAANGVDFAIARYSPDGTLDPVLDGDGKVRLDLAAGSDDAATGVALLADGRLVVAGSTTSGGRSDLAMARLLSNPALPLGVLEIPSPGSEQSGIGLVSGWLCSATSVSVRIDGQTELATAYGTLRGDTRASCGDTNNGFGLLFNWGLLGDGPHLIRAFADGKQFASALFDVTTLGTSFLRGASGAYTLHDFPHPGSSVDVQWVEGLQRFVIRKLTAGAASAPARAAPATETASATRLGLLENPAPGSFQSGIGVISGWVCDGRTVDVRIDRQPAIRAGYGTLRGDTEAVCGDADNGFGLLFNWGLLGDGMHEIDVRVDGLSLGTSQFSVATLGTSFVRGASASYTLADFPESGRSVDVEWDEGQQNFVVVRLR